MSMSSVWLALHDSMLSLLALPTIIRAIVFVLTDILTDGLQGPGRLSA